MYTLGFPFRPWTGEKAIADGAAIRDYVEETAREFGIDRRIRFGHRVVRASWSSAEARWTVEAEADGEVRRFTCAFLFLCSGYYDYEQGYRPRMAGRGAIIAAASSIRNSGPKIWIIAGKRIVVIGSGATAVTLVPALAETAAHVTMLQRSPTYIVARPSRDGIARWLQRRLPLEARRLGDALEERAARHLLLLARPQAAGEGRAAILKLGDRGAARRLRRRARFRAQLQSLGPAPLPGARTAICSRR